MAATERHDGGRGGPSRAGLILTALAFGLAAPACYTYTQVSPAAVAPGSSVRLRTALPAALTAGTSAEGGRIIQGTLLPGSSPDTLVCAVPLSSGEPLAWSHGLSGTVLVPVAEVERLEVRHLQKGRTAAVVAAGAVLGLVVVRWAFDVALPNVHGGDGSGGGNNMRRALLLLRWGLR